MTPRIRIRKKKSSATSSATARAITVRMYNVGFGDCFLVRIPTDAGDRRLLVDCGYHSLGKGAFSDKELVQQIEGDLQGHPLDVVVATHRHQDHISGFGETELWKGIGVEEVWLPFTARGAAASEDPALAAWERLMAAASALFDGEGRLTKAATAALGARSNDEREAAAFMLWNARSNAPGIENLLRGMKRANGAAAQRRFLPDSGTDLPYVFGTPALPGVKVHVLGPPRDERFREKRAVPSGWGVAAEGEPHGTDAGNGSAFGPEWRIAPDHLPGRRPFLQKSLEAIGKFNTDLWSAASAADAFLNGESLVLVLECGRARLLLPGDAEVGSWMTILDEPKALALAAGATFLKVGHHGSRNATPLVFLKEHLAAGAVAAISTQEGEGNYRKGIPRKELLQVVEERGMSFARSDRPMKKATGIFTPGDHGKWIDFAIPC